VDEEAVTAKSAPDEWWKMKKGASTALVGYRDDEIPVGFASASIGWKNEVA